MSSKENPIIELHWPGSGHVLIPEPLQPVGTECADWPSLDHLPTASIDRRKGRYRSTPLKQEGKPNRKSGPDSRGGMYIVMTESTAVHQEPHHKNSQVGRKGLCASMLCVCTSTWRIVFTTHCSPQVSFI